MSSINIHIGRYSDAERAYSNDTEGVYEGWIEPDDKSWILYLRNGKAPELYVDRDPETGAVLSPDESMPRWSPLDPENRSSDS